MPRISGRSVRTLLLLTTLVFPTVYAVEPNTPHTFRLADGEAAPVVPVESLAWMAGTWVGEGFGQTFEEVWTAPSAGSMLGMFKLMDEDEVSFYELLLLTAVEGRLSLRVKHFSPDFVGWEDKGDFVDFKLVATEPDAVHFHGISFYRTGPNTMEAWIVMKSKDGIREEKLSYRRAP